MDALRLPPRRRRIPRSSRAASVAASRCAAAVADTRPAPARRAHQPPRRRVGGLAAAAPAGATPARWWRHPRPLLPRRRAEWILELDRGSGIPYKGNYTGVARGQGRTACARRRRPSRAASGRPQRELDWMRTSPSARQAKSKARLNAYDQLVAEGTAQTPTMHDTAGPAPRRQRGRGPRRQQGLRRQAPRQPHLTLPRGAIVGIGPNGAGKTTPFRLITGQEQPDARAGCSSAVKAGDGGPVRRSADVQSGIDEILGRRRRVGTASGPWRCAPTCRGSTARRAAAAQGWGVVGRSDRAAPGQLAAGGSTRCCSTSPPTTSTSTRRAWPSRRCCSSPAAPAIPATTACSSTASPPTSWPSRAHSRVVAGRGQLPGRRARPSPAPRRAAAHAAPAARSLGLEGGPSGPP